MIKICRIALAWLFLCAQVFAQSIPFPGPGMPASSGGTSFAIAFGAVSSTTTNVANVWTFAGQAIGTSDATRIVVVGIMETLKQLALFTIVLQLSPLIFGMHHVAPFAV